MFSFFLLSDTRILRDVSMMKKAHNVLEQKIIDRIKVNGHSETLSSLEIWCYIYM